METSFLTLGEVLRIHETQINLFGGRDGVRDIGLLESAIEMPRAGMCGSYLHSDLFEMAAAYLFHIVQSHPFLDGNKRTGTVAAIVFLDINDVAVEISNNELTDLVISVACGGIEKAAIAEFLRKHVITP